MDRRGNQKRLLLRLMRPEDLAEPGTRFSRAGAFVWEITALRLCRCANQEGARRKKAAGGGEGRGREGSGLISLFYSCPPAGGAPRVSAHSGTDPEAVEYLYCRHHPDAREVAASYPPNMLCHPLGL
eukprot:359290-Chlamydomonas_euryale.AAC.10